MNLRPQPPQPRPTSIRNDRDTKTLRVEWRELPPTAIDWERLRWACPCAVCQGEMGTPGRLASVTALTDEETTLDGLRGVGNYGVQATWKDGHDTGIYTYTLLFELGTEPRG